MKKALVRILATIGASVVLSLLVSLVLSRVMRGRIEPGTVLELDFADRIVEQAPPAIQSFFVVPPLTVRDVVDALARAAEDARVTTLVARVGDAQLGLGTLQEIRDAVLSFRRAGKRAIAVADTFGEFGPGNGPYYLATGFDEIHLQPSGDLGVTGLAAQTPFVRQALDKLHVTPRLAARREYKSAANVFTETGYTPAHREASERVLASQFAQVVRGIAEGRGMADDAVRTLVARGPLSASDALAAGLVDQLAYRDEVWDRLRGEDGDLPPRLGLGRYLARAGRPNDEGAKVALVYGVGSVHRGRSGWGLLSSEPTMGAETVAGAIRAATDDDDVRGILFRIDSPGGSYVASDTIWREVRRARSKGKPVVASMGDVAGSGGYFVAMAADRIVAHPGTVTGSIGVLAGKLVTGDMWRQVGVEWADLATAPNATMWMTTRDYTDEQWARVQEFLDRIYDDFVGKAAEGRGLARDEMERVARGRIWSGEDAKERGLVDALGGLPEALRQVRELAGLGADADVDVVVFPRTKTPLERVVARYLDRDEGEATARAASLPDVLGRIAATPSVRSLLAMLEGQGTLRMAEPAAVW